MTDKSQTGTISKLKEQVRYAEWAWQHEDDIAEHSTVYLVTGYSDLCKGIDGLSAIVQGVLNQDPFSKSLFLFCGRRRDRIKGLLWEGDGFLLLYKRLDNGTFRWPRNEMKAIGKEFCRDEVVYIPAKMVFRKHYVEVLKCPDCASDESPDDIHPDVPSQVIRKAQAPKAFISHSYCSPELPAHILFEKYVQGIPLYRQEKAYAALEIYLSGTTMANRIIRIAASKVLPVWELMKSELLKNRVIHADETVKRP